MASKLKEKVWVFQTNHNRGNWNFYDEDWYCQHKCIISRWLTLMHVWNKKIGNGRCVLKKNWYK